MLFGLLRLARFISIKFVANSCVSDAISGQTYNLDTTGDLPSLTISLVHRAAFSVGEQPMGEVVIYLDTIDANGAESDQWYDLVPTGRMKNVSGQVIVPVLTLPIGHQALPTP
jgi:hypothetical protein